MIVEVSLSQLRKLLQDEEAAAFRSIRERVQPLSHSYTLILTALRTAAEALAAAEAKEAVIGAPKATVQASKDTLARKLIGLASKFAPAELSRFEHIGELHVALLQMLKQIAEATGMHGKYVAMQFPAEMKTIRGLGKELNEQVQALEQLLESTRPRFNTYAQLLQQCARLEELATSIDVMKRRSDKLATRLRSQEEEQRTIISHLSILETSDAYRHFLAATDAVQALQDRITQLIHRFEQDFGPFRKPLLKLRYAASLEKPELEMLERYLEAPWNTLVSDSDRLLAKFLAKLQEYLKSERIEIKRQEKIVEKIDAIVERIPQLLHEHHELQAAVQRQQTLINASILEQTATLRRRLAEIQTESTEARRKIQELSGTIKAEAAKLAQHAAELEEGSAAVLPSRVKIASRRSESS